MLVSMKEILDKANEGNYAVPAPVVQTELNARTAIKCAEELNSPIILLIPLIFDYDVDLFGRYLKQLQKLLAYRLQLIRTMALIMSRQLRVSVPDFLLSW